MARITLSREGRERIRLARIAAGLSRDELAEKAKVTTKTIVNIETDSSSKTTFNDYTIECVARVLGISVEEITGDDEKPTSNSSSLLAAHRSLTEAALIDFYEKSAPLQVSIGDRDYLIPAELLIAGLSSAFKDVTFFVSHDHYPLSSRIEPYVTPILNELHNQPADGLRIFDGRVASLRSLQKIDGKWIGKVQRGTYFDALATNFYGLDYKAGGESLTLRQKLSGRAKLTCSPNSGPPCMRVSATV